MTVPPAADLDRRLHAFVVDRLVAWTIDAVAAYLAWRFLVDGGAVAAGVGVVVAVVVVVYAALAVVLGLTGSSPGNALLGLRVVAAGTGAPIGVGPALLRQLVVGLATLPTFGLGAATLAWTAAVDPGGRRHGWHDRLVGSEVVDVRPVPAEPEPVPEQPRSIVNLTALRLVPAPPPPSAPMPTAPPAPLHPPQHRAEPAPSPGPAPAEATATTRAPAPAPTRQRLGHPLLPEPAAPHARWRVSFDSGQSFVVEGLTLVGRRPEPRPGEHPHHLLALPSGDLSLSKTHAQFQVVADGVLVAMDRGSTNGSVLLRQGVARDLVAGRPTTLLDGDHVRFGDRIMSVSRED